MSQHQHQLGDELRCDEFVHLVDELIQTPREQWGPAIERHIAECPPCLVYIEQMLDLHKILSDFRYSQQLSESDVEEVLLSLSTQHTYH